MKTLQVVDLLRHHLLRVSAGNEEYAPQDRVLLRRDKENIVVRVLGFGGGENLDTSVQIQHKLTPQEVREYETSQEGERERVIKAQKHAEKLELPMRFFASRVGYKGEVISLFFTSEDLVDFRELLKALSSEFGTRMHLERVGPRDRAKVIGGFGVCGQQTCCSSFRIHLDAVPMDSARDQGLLSAKDTSRLLGLCGRLKCCLLYELPHYREMRKYLPHIRQTVYTTDGRTGRVVGLDILNKRVKVLFESGFPEVLNVSDLQTKGGKPQKKPQRKDDEFLTLEDT